MSTLMQAYARGAPLCFHFSDDPLSVRIVAALVEAPEGLAVANDSVFDLYATKRTSLHPGEVQGCGPWTVGAFTFAVIEGRGPAARAWAAFEAAAQGEGDYRPRLERMLADIYASEL